jgi:Putative prokaryotic signal transducing protein
MRTIVRTPSLSFAESVRLALAASDIEAVILDQNTAIALTAGGGVRVALLHDEDVERATAVVTALQPPKSPPLPSWPWHRRALATFASAFAMLFLRAVLEDVAGWGTVRQVLGVVSVVLFMAAMLLFRRGTRADREAASRREPEGGA